jgi:class 3 adenylate cyclase/predicted ATPase
MFCSKCGSENAPNMKFCGECAEPLAAVCQKCGFDNPPGRKFCGQCAAPLSAPTGGSVKDAGSSADRPLAMGVAPEAADALEGERKTVTALFADIKGSMDLIEDLDPEEARAIVDPALKLMMEAVHHYSGYVAQSTGDGIFALFGAPIAHEDHPQRALYAALRMLEEVKRHAEKLRAEKGVNLQVRVGVNTGEVVVRSISTGDGHVEYIPVGHSTSLASRLQALAAPGSVAISETVRKLVEGYFTLNPLGPARIKGVSEPVKVYEVTGLGPLRTRLQRSAGRGYTKFVGRQREIDVMKHAAELARSGHGQIVAVMAEAGIGKSRLFLEFKASPQFGSMMLETGSESHGKANAFLPVIDLLRNYFKINSEDSEQTRRAKVTSKVLAVDRALEGELPYLFGLLGILDGDGQLAQMDPQIRKRRTLEAVKRTLLRESLNQPLIVIFEDLHWVDEETQVLLNLLAESIATARLVLFVNYRPEYSHHWGNKTYYTQLRLDPLPQESAEEVLRDLLGEGSDTIAIKRMVIEKTQGNPFFMEEIVQALFEQGALLRNGGAVKLGKPLHTIHIPTTVQGVLTSRIDRLHSAEKALLQTMAVIGTEFSMALLREVTALSGEELNKIMAPLRRAEFIYELPALADVEYTFKHALTHDVSYNSVLTERRKLLHEQTGSAIERLYHDRLDDHLSKLAHHYARSNNAAKAIHYLRLAGRQAAQRSANREAVAHFRSALELLKSLPDSKQRQPEELDLLIMLGPVLMMLAGYAAEESREIYVRARELQERLGDDSQLFPVLWGLWISHGSRGELNKARELAGELMSSAERLDDNALRITGHHALWNTLFYLGDLKACLRHTESGIALYNPVQHAGLASLYGGHDAGVCAWNHGGQLWWLLGYPDRALKSIGEAVALARQIRHTASLAQALSLATMINQFRRDRVTTIAEADATLALSAEHGFAQWVTMGTILRAWATRDHAAEDELAKMRDAIAQWRAGGAHFYLAYYLALAAETCWELKQVDIGREIIADALQSVRRTGERWYEAELHRLNGELSLLGGVGTGSDSEQHFRRAIEVAREQEAKSLELRATISLAGLLRDSNRRDAARVMLAEIYYWFTEGFDTADLKDARALLVELENR